MAIKKSVFGSDSERELYQSLRSRWADKFNIWPGVSFLDIFDLNKVVRKLKLTQKQINYMKTWPPVDITLCKRETDEPIMSIEFDGMCHGFSRLGQYIQVHNAPEVPMRKKKMDLKLQVAETFRYPYFIVSYQEKNPVGEDLHLTIVDGIIGQCLARQDTKVLIKERLELHREYLEALPPEELDIVFEDIITDAEVDADFLHDPIVIKAAEYSNKLFDKGFVDHGCSYNFLSHPPYCGDKWPSTVDDLIDRVLETESVGCRFTLTFPQKEFEGQCHS